MPDLVHQEEYINQEEDFQGNSTDIYYIVNKATGRAQGKIKLHQIENLAIVPARIPEPDQITAQQVDALISPRNITLVTTAKKSLTGRPESPPHKRFVGQIIRGIHRSVFGITIKEFGEIIFAKQEGRIVCAKYINFYYKGGKEKGKYCQLTHFLQVDPANTIPNWKFIVWETSTEKYRQAATIHTRSYIISTKYFTGYPKSRFLR
jgi:hypothetical protein